MRNDLPFLLQENDLVVIDTCAIFSKGFVKLIQKNAKNIVCSKKSVILHRAVMNELIRISKEPRHLKYYDAKKILPILYALESANVFRFIGDDKDLRFADQQFIEYVIDSRMRNRMVLITLDKGLSSDILMQNKLQSFRGNAVRVFGISDEGELYEYLS